MNPTEYTQFTCPYCLTQNNIAIDLSCDLEQNLIIDCQRCCQPISLYCWLDDSELHSSVQQIDD